MRFAEIPYPITERFLTVEGARICYGVVPTRAQDDRKHLPFLLIPPLGRGLLHYAPNLDALSRHAPVLVYDPPGCGKSDKAGPALALVAPNAQARVALAVLETARAEAAFPAQPVTALGTSYGAVIALALGGARPDLVDCLVLSSLVGAPLHPLRRMLLLALARSWALRCAGEGFWRRGLTNFFWDARHPAIEQGVHLIRGLRAGPDWNDYVAALAATTRAFLRTDVEELVVRLRADTRVRIAVIWGERDRVTPVEWAGALASRHGIGFHMINGVGHFPNVEAASPFTELAVSLAYQGHVAGR
ncbi:MAG: alpha/beta hydrolase [Planctomycetes bacterium]|nr:alpha/beta hydrolase [Planctomycetota bacterium]